MKRAGWAVATALLATGAVLWWRYGAGQALPTQARERAALQRVDPARADDSVTSDAGSPQREATPAPAPRDDYAARLRAASDYLEFIRSLNEAAGNGDHAAQFHVFRAFDYCDDGYRGYFWSRHGQLTLDAALKRAATRFPFDTEEVRRVHARCHKLMQLDARELGERLEWLRLAAEGGYPLAQVVAAQRQWQAMTPSENDNAERVEERRRLVAKAIRSREPEVIWEIGNTPLDFERRDDDEMGEVAEYEVDHQAWWLAACARGLDCSPRSEIVSRLCRFDPGCQPYESVADILRRGNEAEFPEIEARARWISEKIEAGDWEALGF